MSKTINVSTSINKSIEEVWKEVSDLKGKDRYGNHYTEEQKNYWDGFIG